jgi:glycosyltransferase involved in cell wall biosynthesis
VEDLNASSAGRDCIRLYSVVEAETVTGPMKPLLMFARNIQLLREGRTEIVHSIATTIRVRDDSSLGANGFIDAAEGVGLSVDSIRERFLFDWSVLAQLAAYLAARKPHIIETHDFKSHFLVWLLKRFRRLPDARWIAFHHGYTRMSARVRVYQQLDRVSLRAADRVVTVCLPFARQLEQRGVKRDRIRILANAIESRARLSESELRLLKQRLGLRPTDRAVVSIGRLSVEKGHATLIAAYRALSKTKDVRLILVGDGGERERLKTAADDLGERVVFTGHVNDPWPYHCLADVFVLPSYSEGSPLALLEAMSASAPIVASDVGGIPELLSNETSALLVPPGSVNDLARSVERILHDSDLAKRLGAGASKVAQQFTPDQYARDRILIYESVLAPRGTKAESGRYENHR